jgi:hypothetical protein
MLCHFILSHTPANKLSLNSNQRNILQCPSLWHRNPIIQPHTNRPIRIRKRHPSSRRNISSIIYIYIALPINHESGPLHTLTLGDTLACWVNDVDELEETVAAAEGELVVFGVWVEGKGF